MKLTYFQLEPHLASKSLSAIYIISGDELLLKQDAIQLIRRSAKQAGFTERTRINPDTDFDWEQLYPLLHSPSLMGDKHIIELDFRDHLPNKAANVILEDYAKTPSADHLLIIDCAKVDDKIARSGWFKALEKSGTHLAIWPIPHEQLPKWIIQRAKKYKLTITLEAAHLLADYVEGNLIAAAQAIEKIYLLKPEGQIEAALVRSVLTDESRYTVFDFIDALTAGECSRALTILTNLQLEGTEPIFVLWAITRELRLLAEIGKKTQQGSSLDALFQQHRIFARRQNAIKRCLTKFNYQDFWRLLEQTASLDKIIKGAQPGNIWNAMQLFCLKMMTAPSSSPQS